MRSRLAQTRYVPGRSSPVITRNSLAHPTLFTAMKIESSPVGGDTEGTREPSQARRCRESLLRDARTFASFDAHGRGNDLPNHNAGLRNMGMRDDFSRFPHFLAPNALISCFAGVNTGLDLGQVNGSPLL